MFVFWDFTFCEFHCSENTCVYLFCFACVRENDFGGNYDGEVE